MDVKFFKPFVDGTKETLKTMCQVEANHGKPYKKGEQVGQSIDVGIAANLSLSSSTFSGSISICFTKNSFLNLLGNMLGETFSEINKDTQDGAAELLNIIFGHAKRVLNSEGHDIQKAIPSIVVGNQLSTVQLSSSPVYVLPFTSSAGDFQIEISADAKSLTGEQKVKAA